MKFELYGQFVEYKEDLKKFYYLKEDFNNRKNKLLKGIEPNFKNKNDIEKIIDEINNYVENDIKYVISELSNFDIYNLTTQDFLQSNEGYANILNIETIYLNLVVDITKKGKEITETELLRAQRNAEQKITGLDFGVISNNLVAHLMYASQNERELKKQAKAAEKEYNQTANKILNTVDESINDILDDAYFNRFIPTLKQGIEQCYSSLFMQYASKLAEINQLDLSCSEEMDYERSSTLLKNVDIVNDKKKLFVNIIKLCPFNFDVYKKLISLDLISNDVVNIVKYFGFTEKLISNILDDKNMNPEFIETENFEAYYRTKESLIYAISKFTESSKQEVIMKFFSEPIIFLKSNTIKVLQNLRTYEDCKNNYFSEITSSIQADQEHTMFDKWINQECRFGDITYICNEMPSINFLDNFSKYASINDLEDFFKFLREKFEEYFPKYIEELKKIEELEREELLKKHKLEQELAEAKKLKEERIKNNIKKALLFGIPSIIILILAFGLISNMIEKRNEEMYNQAINYVETGQDYEKAIEIFEKLGDYKESKEYYEGTKLIVQIVDDYNSKDYFSALKNINKANDKMFNLERSVIDNCRENLYIEAVENYNEASLEEAKEKFNELNDYKDSSTYINNIEKLINFDEKWDDGEVLLSACYIDNIPKNSTYEEKINKILEAKDFYGNLIGSWNYPNEKFPTFYAKLVLNDDGEVVVEVTPSSLDEEVTTIQTTGEKENSSFKAKVVYNSEYSFKEGIDVLLTVKEEYDDLNKKDVYSLSIENNDTIYEDAYFGSEAYRDK